MVNKSSNADYFRCEDCGVAARFSLLPVYYTVKVKFPGYDEFITIFHNQLQEYAAKFGVSLSEEAITDSFILNSNCEMIVSHKNICVKFL